MPELSRAPALSQELFEKLFPVIAYAQKSRLFDATVALVRKPAHTFTSVGMVTRHFTPTEKNIKKAARNHGVAEAAFRNELGALGLSDPQREALLHAADVWQKAAGIRYLFIGLAESAS